ncbi:hypothetical protein SARC_13215 [Sphaeroforma arctica JP610]|uniref:Uncharacterized protein n=1 Tax=Sphaeroforma arctica JP610 TaxID=667725 RepID=A0A0L0FBU4_9EUKA|nr:hypothetical protein SARC_13215 [Sphaeroforma arctica JP610]KNC74232.1 hypothetical protein SARC_13215 [Sphaeroforma arctica JP610]|eukprot:XP_014148134.1 hypothetical protein SARC_13215 [Sphaeroforma arctica JP610]
MEVPGKVIYFYEDAAAENDAEDKGDLYNMVLCDALFPSFTRISIDPRLVFDHACASYESAFKRLTRAMKDRAEGESEKDLEVAPETEKKVKQLDE